LELKEKSHALLLELERCGAEVNRGADCTRSCCNGTRDRKVSSSMLIYGHPMLLYVYEMYPCHWCK